MSLSKALLNWRSKQKRGAIMKPDTFESIKKKSMKSGLSKMAATNIAGKAYWSTAKLKFKRSKSD